MATTNNNRKILDLKRWEFCTPAPATSGAGHFIVSSRHYRQQQLLVQSATSAYLYNPQEDGWVALPSPALGGTFGAGACGTAAAFSTGATIGVAALTATAGTTQSITTDQTLARRLDGYSVQIMSGPNAGEIKTIAKNTIGANAVITFTAASAVAFSASTTYRLITPTFYVLNAGSQSATSFKKYDFATNTWTALAYLGLPATIGTDARLVATPSWTDGESHPLVTGTATGGGASTLDNSGKNWTVNQWRFQQVRITAGTGAGQVRQIQSNTATQLTTTTAWATAPDATSQYAIEGNDNAIWFIGNNAVTMFRYLIDSNTWQSVSPIVARAAAPSTGMSAHWIYDVTDPDWNIENTFINGTRIYSFRGGAGAVLDYFDIGQYGWVNAVPYSPAVETLTTGTKYAYSGNYLYIQKDATGRWFRFNFATQEMDGWGAMLYAQGAAVLGDTAFDVIYKDGATEVVWIYMLLNTSAVLLRQMVF